MSILPTSNEDVLATHKDFQVVGRFILDRVPGTLINQGVFTKFVGDPERLKGEFYKLMVPS